MNCPRPDAPGMATGDSTTSVKPFRGRSRRRQWEQLSRGLYIPRASPSMDVLRGWQLVLPDTAAFTSLTAAEVRGWWLPEAIPHPVFAAVPIGERYPERAPNMPAPAGAVSRGLQRSQNHHWRRNTACSSTRSWTARSSDPRRLSVASRALHFERAPVNRRPTSSRSSAAACDFAAP